jgi:hypothetical protein
MQFRNFLISFLAWISLDASSFLSRQLVVVYSLIVAESLWPGWVAQEASGWLTQEASGASRWVTSDLPRLVPATSSYSPD